MKSHNILNELYYNFEKYGKVFPLSNKTIKTKNVLLDWNITFYNLSMHTRKFAAIIGKKIRISSLSIKNMHSY